MTHSMYRIGCPVVLAHRGGMGSAPENTRAAVAQMLATGVRTLETDVRETSDGVAVLAHDETLQRRFGDPRPVSEVTWWELDLMRDVDDQPALRLVDLLAEFPDVGINIDVKSDGAVTPTLRAVREAGAAARVCLTSFSSERLDVMARLTRGRTALGAGAADVARLVARARGLTELPGADAVGRAWGRGAGGRRRRCVAARCRSRSSTAGCGW
ncbi:glycerophosphodiester phosphodiesterase family protein [Litorihabitans aurantiacus]|uniref:GP-PDE domain-containing protein n=1 Tax=Litorihabitans aurantiacus TaxID=1930061 RepID=A0AA38CSX3_9MICO|nr:glycerophosphodiester phosphodiesterase family protein [Litorihabitans aurantiacus]GMA31944.1 hypothetical protein GCM10025875_19360 [Litorihabitans aurantiacus]